MSKANGRLKETQALSAVRDYGLDNIRFILIFLVVFAHLLEVCAPFPGRELIYKGIYSFHMPAFLFLFGYNARFSVRRIVFRWIIPYIVFQTLYTLFRNLVLNDDADFQYVVPYWILWYMLVGIMYQALLPFLGIMNARGRKWALLSACASSLLIGYMEAAGYFLSLSRFFVFLPWFLLGHELKSNSALRLAAESKTARIMAAAALFAAMALTAAVFRNVTNDLLYGAASYEKCGSGIFMRAVVLLIAFFWVFFLFVCVKPCFGRKLAFITKIGQNTWPVFLLHGFLVKIIPVCFPGWLNFPWQAALITSAVLLITGNRWFDRVVYGIGLTWMQKVFDNALSRYKN